MNKIKEITICLHCGCSREVVNAQMEALKSLEDHYIIHWNNRIDRHPGSYNSYSELVNDAIITSPTEWMIFINDRTKPIAQEVEHILQLLENGFAVATKYSVGFIGYSKQLIRTIGWWDERYYGGGYEDDDFVLRLRLANLAYYESEESTYDKSWISPLRPVGGGGCRESQPEFRKKWAVMKNEIRRVIPELNYEKYAGKLGKDQLDIQQSWNNWSYSQLGIMFHDRMINNSGGESRTKWFLKDDYKTEFRKVTSV
jgi:hypothetical protein